MGSLWLAPSCLPLPGWEWHINKTTYDHYDLVHDVLRLWWWCMSTSHILVPHHFVQCALDTSKESPHVLLNGAPSTRLSPVAPQSLVRWVVWRIETLILNLISFGIWLIFNIDMITISLIVRCGPVIESLSNIQTPPPNTNTNTNQLLQMWLFTFPLIVDHRIDALFFPFSIALAKCDG